MSLPSQAIDRLFDRLAATYGRQWLLMWEGVDGNAVKALWGHELSGFSASLFRIAWALENLPPRCPNVVEFKHLCRQAPAPDEPRLPEPKANPERVKAELEKLGGMRQKAPAAGRNPHKDWARNFIARHEAGEKIRQLYLKWAHEALGMPTHNMPT